VNTKLSTTLTLVLKSLVNTITHSTSCARGDTTCPAPLPRGRLSASRAAEQTQRSTFPRRIRSHADRCSCLTR